MNEQVDEIVQIIKNSTSAITVSGKIGQRVLQPHIARTLTAYGFNVDIEDQAGFLPPGLAVWRDKHSCEVVETTGRRRIDLVIRKADKVLALIETESDLNDLREEGVSNRDGHYDVFSIARCASGMWFDSYKSLERMAAAAWYSAGRTRADLENVRSNSVEIHNSAGIGLILVSGRVRSKDRRVLAPRLGALGAHLIGVTETL
jgi:hypothetical protein